MLWILRIPTCFPSAPHNKAQLETSSSRSETESLLRLELADPARPAGLAVSPSNAFWQALYQLSHLTLVL